MPAKINTDSFLICSKNIHNFKFVFVLCFCKFTGLLNNNNNNLIHLYSAFLGTQCDLHSKGESPHPPPMCSIHLMI